MIDTHSIDALLFDYGGTIDSNGLHWSEVIWKAYQAEDVPVSKESFRSAYVHAERTMGRIPLVQPHHTFADMMRIKTELQVEWLQENADLPSFRVTRDLKRRLADRCYGNISSVLRDFRLDRYFPHIIESATVGIRKPDPAIFRLALDALHLTDASRVVVIGDSHDKDILPSASLGCRTVWLKNIGWRPYTGTESADEIITDFRELKSLLL